MKTTSVQLKLLTTRSPRTNFDAFPSGLHEYTPITETAMYYGFTPVRPLKSSDIEPEVKKALAGLTFSVAAKPEEQQGFNFSEKAELVKMYREDRIPALPSPTMLLVEKPRLKVRGVDGLYKHQYSLECLGVRRSIAEALIIQTTYSALEAEGFKKLTVELNSLGDSDSRHWFEQALHQYIRSVLPSMPPEAQKRCRQDPYMLFTFSDPWAEPLKREAPEPLTYLSEPSRAHLSELLEYLEALNIPYLINSTLISHKDLQSQIIFRIIDSAAPAGRPTTEPPKRQLLACLGMRYTPLARRLGFRREIPAVGAHLSYLATLNPRRLRKRKIDPRFSFVHLGFEAKLKSLQVINILRKKKIPLCHSLTKDKLAPQISAAQRLQLPYLIIMGQKEALENTVVVRDREGRAQEIVPINDLPQYLKAKK